MDKRKEAFILAVERTSLLHADYLGAKPPRAQQKTERKIKIMRKAAYPQNWLEKIINRLQLLHKNGLRVQLLKLAIYETLLQVSEEEWRERFYANLLAASDDLFPDKLTPPLVAKTPPANPSPAIRNLEGAFNIHVDLDDLG